MGAFFLYKIGTVNPNPALDLFTEMGFSLPRSAQIGGWVVYAYPKIAIPYSNLISDGDCILISTGSPIYKGLNYENSLKELLSDFKNNSVESDNLIGQYTLLFCNNTTIKVLRDPLGCKHLFADKECSIISSHMLPICQCLDEGLHVNRMAFYEKFLTGIIMPPNTLFDEIIQIDKTIADSINKAELGIEFLQPVKESYSEEKKRHFQQCLVEQADTLRDYFGWLNNASKNGGDIGLSGGYDSRLVLACLNQYTKGKLHLHSHSTENVHKSDLAIANQMADYVGVPCHTVPTKKLKNSNNNEEIVRKSILYFDGRDSYSIGGCGEVYTASYREESTEKTPLTLTGVGGELYRNVFDMGIKKVRVEDFLKKKVFSSSYNKAVSETLYQNICNDIIARVSARLGIDKKSKQTKEIAHRYYCEVMMPDGQGVAVDAYNQVSCCIAPFLESRIIAKGYEAIPFHGSGGEFEGKLIDYIDAGLASIPSSYGYPIRKRPIKAKIKERLRILISASVWNNLSKLLGRGESYFNLSKALDELYANTQTLKEAYDYLVELFPEINFTWLLHSSEEIRKVQFAAMTLFILKERIKVQ